MSKSTHEFLNHPDPLTGFFASLDIESDIYADGQYIGDWAIDTSGKKQIPFHGIAAGEAQIWLNNECVGTLTAGDVVLFPFDHSHQMRPIDIEQKTRMICGFFNVNGISHQRLLQELSPVIIHSKSESKQLLWQQILNEIDAQKPGCYFAFNLYAKLLFLDILRVQLHKKNDSQGILNGLVNHKINPALDLIHRQYQDDLTLEHLATHCHLSKNTFARLFKKSIGQTPYQYLCQWRLEKSRQLLNQQQLTISQVAEAVGYQSDIVFRKAFKTFFGFNAYDLIR